MRHLITAVLCCFALSQSTLAQPQDGDLLLSDDNGDLLYVSWPSGALNTLVAGLNPTGMTALPGNQSIAVQLTDGQIVTVAADGTVTSMATLPQTGGGQLVLDQDGSLLASSKSGGSIFRVEGSIVTPLLSQTGFPFVLGLDRHDDIGDLVMVDNTTNFYTVDRLTGAKNILGAGLEYTANAILFVKSAGTLWVDYPTGDDILTYEADGTFTGSLGTGGYYLVYDERRDRAFAAATSAGLHKDVLEFTADGTLVTSQSFHGRTYRGVAIWGARNLTLGGTGALGTTVSLQIDFPESPSVTYCAALSLANRPGLPLGGQLLNLAPDGLFFATVCGSAPAFPGFSGQLSASGQASASFALPASVALPLSVQVGVVAIDPAKPSGYAVGNVEVLKLYPFE